MSTPAASSSRPPAATAPPGNGLKHRLLAKTVSDPQPSHANAGAIFIFELVKITATDFVGGGYF